MSDLTYLYCVIQRDKPPPLARAPMGLPGTGKPRLIDAGGGLWLIAADAPAAEYGTAAIERGYRALPPTWAAVRFRSGPSLPARASIRRW